MLFEEERIKTHYVDIVNNQTIDEMMIDFGVDYYDIIVEDSWHQFEAPVNFFSRAFSKLEQHNGLYIIEDLNENDCNKWFEMIQQSNTYLASLVRTRGYFDKSTMAIFRKV